MRFFSILGTTFFAIPFFFLWNYFAPIYLPQLPLVYQNIPFWHCVGIFALLGVVRASVFSCSRPFFFHGSCHKKW